LSGRVSSIDISKPLLDLPNLHRAFEWEPKRLIFVKESQEGASKLIESDVEKVVTAWAQGKFVVPIWLDVIYGRSREVELKR
ncbi:MAG TPA: hypothetical protein DDZ60_22060, partial [Planktothrix sp. UBA10369]|nr:hypothetical protein [Planktothrix sp. UBA10369]